MSMLLMVKAMNQKVGNPLRKLVLIKLADNANDNGECFPSYKYIADICEISKRSVIGHVDALCEMNLIKKELRPGPKGNTSNLNIIFPDIFGHGASAGDAPPSAGYAPVGGAGYAPGISHSFESVNESITPIPPTGDDSDSKGRNKTKVNYDKQTIVKCWNDKADRYGLPRIRAVSETTAKRLNKFYTKYRKLQKELGKQSREATDIICRFIEAYEPSKYALGDNPAGKKHGIDIAFVDWFVDQELAKE